LALEVAGLIERDTLARAGLDTGNTDSVNTRSIVRRLKVPPRTRRIMSISLGRNSWTWDEAETAISMSG